MASKLNTSIIAKIFILRTATLAKERYPAIKDKKKKKIYIYIYIYRYTSLQCILVLNGGEE